MQTVAWRARRGCKIGTMRRCADPGVIFGMYEPGDVQPIGLGGSPGVRERSRGQVDTRDAETAPGELRGRVMSLYIFLNNGTGPLGALSRWAVETGLIVWVDRLIVFGLIAAGVSLMLGLFTRAGCVGALLLLTLFRLALNVSSTRLILSRGEGGALVLRDDRVDTGVLQADRVEHAGRRLGHPRRWVAHPRSQRGALAADGAQALDVDHVAVLDAVAEGARGDQQRVA